MTVAQKRFWFAAAAILILAIDGYIGYWCFRPQEEEWASPYDYSKPAPPKYIHSDFPTAKYWQERRAVHLLTEKLAEKTTRDGLSNADLTRLVELATFEDAETRRKAIAVLSMASNPAGREQTIELFVGRLKDEDSGVRAAAATGLANLGAREKAAGLTTINIESDLRYRCSPQNRKPENSFGLAHSWENSIMGIGFKSRHPSGAHVLFADGSVHFLSNDIDHGTTYQFLGCRDDGQAVGSDW